MFTSAPEQLCRDVQVVHCTTLGPSFTLCESRHRIIFQKIAAQCHMPVYHHIAADGRTVLRGEASFCFAHKPSGSSSKESYSIQLNARGNFSFYYFCFDVKQMKTQKVDWKTKWIVQP